MYADAEFKEDEVDDAEEFVCGGCLMRPRPYEYRGQQRQAPNLYLVAPQEGADYQQERQAA